MIEAGQSSTFDAVVDGAPTGLTGTIGVTITDLSGNVVAARSTSSITEISTGIYVKTGLTAPATTGDYLVIWDTGGATPVKATENLKVKPVTKRISTDNITVVNRSGDVQPNKAVWIYQKGTTTPVTVWTAETGGSTVAQPLMTDDDGYPMLPGGGTAYVDVGTYDVVADGFDRVLHWVAGTDATAAAGGAAGGDLRGSYPNPTIAILTDSGQKIVTAEQFGAVGDGVTDDTNALRAALNSLRDVGGILLLGPKTYLVNGAPSTAESGNAILPLPLAGAGLGSLMPYQFEYSEIIIRGTDGETVIRTTRTDGTYSGANGAPSVIGGPTPEQVPSPAVVPASLGTVEIDGVMVVVEAEKRDVTDAAITTGTATLTSATANFTAADVGKWVTIQGAGASGKPLATTITARTNSTTVTLAANASATVSGAVARIGSGPTFAGVDLWYARAARTGRLRVHDSQQFAGDSAANRIVTTNKWAFGYRTPNSFNFWEVGLGGGGVLHTAGFYVGVVLGTINVDLRCVVATHVYLAYGLHILPALKHSVHLSGYMICTNFKYGLANWNETAGAQSLPGPDKFYLNGSVWAMEQGDVPFDLVTTVLDANNLIVGRLKFSRLASGSVLTTPGTVSGGASFDLSPVQAGYESFGKGLMTRGGFTVPGVLAEHFADVNDTGALTVLWSDTVPGGLLQTDGDKIEAHYSGITIAHATNTRQMDVRYAGNTLLSTNAFATTAANVWVIDVYIIRTSATSIRYVVVVNRAQDNSSGSGTSFVHTGDMTFASGHAVDQTLVVRSTSSGGVQGNTGKLAIVKYLPQSVTP